MLGELSGTLFVITKVLSKNGSIGGVTYDDNKTYDTLKWIAMYLLPALGTLYFALAGIWNFPYGEQVVGTITAVDTFLGVILGISTSQYNKTSEDATK